MIVVEPGPVVEHDALEVLRRRALGILNAADASAALAAEVDGKGESSLVIEAVRMIGILHLKAVIGVEAPPIGNAQKIGAVIVIRQHRDPFVRPVEYLRSHARRVIEHAVRLPAVDDPRLDLEMLIREDLNTNAVEEPRRIRRYVGRLICPVIKVVIAEQSDVRQEDAGVEVNAAPPVPVISAVRLG